MNLVKKHIRYTKML